MRTFMFRIVTVSALASVLVGVVGCSANPGDSDPPPTAEDISYLGTGTFDGCSGSLVIDDGMSKDDKALFLTNGHCSLDDSVLGRANIDKPLQESVNLSDAEGAGIAAVQIEKRVYWTMTETDVALLQLSKTYGEIDADFGIRGRMLDPEPARVGQEIEVVAAAVGTSVQCSVARVVPTVMEVGLQTRDVMSYSPECSSQPGASGAAVIDRKTNKIMGINNSHNTSGGQCLIDEPCEVDRDGKITVVAGASYAPPVAALATCLKAGKLDLAARDCLLPKP
ncbi:trypsin-like peptidase domain-containing protein [Rhodococcus sp. 14-2483-1-2]|uniref:trypsin-like peptidase domain-containing protein n=1 Tax=Rhodococcus sp. 14-2483-1-2 TaxID=2023147 RepID=UPI000B9C3E4C|nr:trypsin-like peptidase domain-containing protein [Rhodococcus sp. 14-2483-1-2]OZF28534.1 hypothetical protein CH295_18840 [Rhodococcus sp. 14-2483-1-2]